MLLEDTAEGIVCLHSLLKHFFLFFSMKRPVSRTYIHYLMGLLVLTGSLPGCNQNQKAVEESPSNQPATTDSARTVSTKAADGGASEGVALTEAQYRNAGIQLGQPETRTLSTTLKLTGTLDVAALSTGSSAPVDLKATLDGMLAREGRQELALRCFDFVGTRSALDLAGWDDEDIFAH